MTGRAAIVREANLVEIEEIPVPGPLGPHDVLVETEFTFISAGTELANFTGLDPGVQIPGSWNHYPARPGYANCGRVVELGSASTPWRSVTESSASTSTCPTTSSPSTIQTQLQYRCRTPCPATWPPPSAWAWWLSPPPR